MLKNRSKLFFLFKFVQIICPCHIFVVILRGFLLCNAQKRAMIEYIKGKLSELNPTYAVLEAAGVGYEINITLPTYSALAGKEANDKGLKANSEGLKANGAEANGEEVKLFVEEIIREDTHDLFGFFTKGERELFIMLMTVSGIGANTARMIMSAYTAGEIRQIIATGNSRALAQIKGLGPKTAQRIIVDLKDKVLKIDLSGDGLPVTGDEVPTDVLFPEPESPVKAEAVSALTMLGFAAAASAKAVDKILKETPSASVEAVIRQALKML